MQLHHGGAGSCQATGICASQRKHLWKELHRVERFGALSKDLSAKRVRCRECGISDPNERGIAHLEVTASGGGCRSKWRPGACAGSEHRRFGCGRFATGSTCSSCQSSGGAGRFRLQTSTRDGERAEALSMSPAAGRTKPHVARPPGRVGAGAGPAGELFWERSSRLPIPASARGRRGASEGGSGARVATLGWRRGAPVRPADAPRAGGPTPGVVGECRIHRDLRVLVGDARTGCTSGPGTSAGSSGRAGAARGRSGRREPKGLRIHRRAFPLDQGRRRRVPGEPRPTSSEGSCEMSAVQATRSHRDREAGSSGGSPARTRSGRCVADQTEADGE